MCGICGLLNFTSERPDAGTLQAMTDSIRHRGPDGEGFYIDGPIGFGHRRLAIIDLSEAAAQPMVSNDGRYILTYNGEVYNFQELRKELREFGYEFRSTSDTEVILVAYQHWGRSCVERFNGMFAFAIWDTRKQELFLARDRYGIKPLYYAFFGSTFLFGSEQKAILAHPAVSREMDREALLEYFTFQNFFTNRTLLKGITTFPAGSTATLSSTGSRDLRIHQYWDYDFSEPEYPLTEAEYLEELDMLLAQAVNRQMVSDVEVGAYLSGGIDSGSISALAAQSNPYIKSFTCGFDLHSSTGLEAGFDERERAELMSYLFKTEHYEMVLKAGDMERCLPRLAYHLEEPRVGQSYPNYYIAQLASKFVKVVLGGAGGDELFGGYPWRYYRAATCFDFEDYIDKYYVFWQRLIPNEKIQKVFAPIWGDVGHVWTRDIFSKVFGDRNIAPSSSEQFINNSLHFEAKTFLHGLLVVKDKLSMAHSLEARVPFLDNDLVDFAMHLPVRTKLGNLNEVIRINENESKSKVNKYYQKTRDGKLILRKAAAKYVPEGISTGVKQGFSAPDASWFRGESIKFVADALIKKNARIYDYLDKDVVQSLVMEHLSGKENRRLLIWSLLNVEEWIGQFLDEGDA
ncbi:asparagine synthase (glutamine-hydrolyzing) [uncultured Pseudodesulfovibrio sp.]|uniref:asparagine synthase (glutamine-hydrolyzing) n=1 Tax=uncultured Pseudodesulfovibrio sp. TaxID=2035858 RepID=UPI0029C8DEA7|nr:asparagine synthase (glutamine-hydrolyzing) [uncultured Pseudodesulfovibrio sp.]